MGGRTELWSIILRQAQYITEQSPHPNSTEREIQLMGDEIRVALLIYPAILIVMGIPSNLLVIGILRTPTLRRKSISLYFTYIAVWNIFNLTFNTSRYWLRGLIDFDIRHFSLLFCKFHLNFAMVGHQMVNWIMVLASVAKVMFILYPQSSPGIYQKTYIHIQVAGLLSVSTAVTVLIHHGRYYHHLEGVNGRLLSECNVRLSGLSLRLLGCFTFFLPGLLLVFLNLGIICLYDRMTIRCSVAFPRKYARQKKLVRRLAVILFCCEVQIFATELPYAIIVSFSDKLFHDETMVSQYRSARTYIMASMLLYTNYSVNFVIYCFFGDHFRAEIRRKCRPCLRRFVKEQSLWVISTSDEPSPIYEHSYTSSLSSLRSLANLFVLTQRYSPRQSLGVSSCPHSFSLQLSRNQMDTANLPERLQSPMQVANFPASDRAQMKEIQTYMRTHIGLSRLSMCTIYETPL